MELGIDGVSQATEIGSGGSASVYRATQDALGREVAVKILHVHFGVGDETERRRFSREQMALGRLSEFRGIVPLYESGFTESGRPYLIMPLYERGSLQDRLDRDGPIDWSESAELMIGAARAVQRAHDAGVLHRDVKPANIMIDRDGEPVVGDFGVARLVGSTTLFQSRALSTTPAYAPPEVFAGEEPTVAVDVYGLGASLFALINGSPAFVSLTGDLNVLALMRRVETQPVPDLTEHEVPPSITAVIERSMAKTPSHRHPTASAWSDELEGAIRAASPPPDHAPVMIPPAATRATEPDEGVDEARTGDTDDNRALETPEPVVIASGATPTEPTRPDPQPARRWPEERPHDVGRRAEPDERGRRMSGAWIAAAAVIVLLIAVPIALSDGEDGDDPADTAAPEQDGEDVTSLDADLTFAGAFEAERASAVRGFIDVYNSATGSSVGFEAVSSEFDLRDRIDAGDRPDVAAVSDALYACTLADDSPGLLVSVEDVGLDPDALRSQHSDFWMDQTRCSDGEHYGIPFFTDAMSLVYYHLPTFEARGYAIPTTYAELIDLTERIARSGMTPWCFGFESGAASGWPATDWIEEIVLRQDGIEFYRQWIDHEIPFDAPEIQAAFDAFAAILFAEGSFAGGPAAANATNFADAPAPLFEDPPGCLMHKQGSFIESFFDDGGESQISSFRFPAVGGNDGMIVSGPTLLMFNEDPATVQAISDWTSPGWQCTLASPTGGGIAAHGGHGVDGVEFLPGHVDVDPNCFDTGASHQRASWIVEAIATNTLALDASNLMAPEVGLGSFWSGMLQWTRSGMFEWAQGASTEEVTASIEATWPM